MKQEMCIRDSNNISMGKPDATEEEVYEAAKKARCYDFIMALPDVYKRQVRGRKAKNSLCFIKCIATGNYGP